MSWLDRRPCSWLLLGMLLVVGAHLRFGVGLLAWFVAVPFLRFLRLRPGAAWAVIAASIGAWTLAMLKICTGPVPLVFAPVFGVPMGLTFAGPLVLYVALRRRLQTRLAPLLFPAAMGVGEWAQQALTPFGSWGAAAFTQVDLLPLLQVAAVTGTAGVSFLVHLGNVALEERLALGQQGRALGRGAAALIGAAFALGQVRLTAGEVAADTVRVAAVGTDATFAGLPIPNAAERTAVDDGIEARVRRAAVGGARIIVTTEAASLALPEDEVAWRARWAALAAELGVELVVGYIVPEATEPLSYENKAVVFSRAGAEVMTWWKHHPVPGEPAKPGTAPASWSPADGARLGLAICYDADFGRLGLEQARAGIDLLALPSSDWRGIDPLHTEMSRLRAIEGGYGIVRSTRMGRSAVVDALGRVRGYEGAHDSGERVLIAELPRRGSPTPYALLGDWLVLLSAAALGGAILRVARPGPQATMDRGA